MLLKMRVLILVLSTKFYLDFLLPLAINVTDAEWLPAACNWTCFQYARRAVGAARRGFL